MKKLILIPVIVFAVIMVFMTGCEKKTEENKAIARRAFEEVWSQGKLDVIDEIYATDFIYHAPTGEIRGLEEFKQLVTMYRNAYPDLQFTVEDQIAEGDKVVTRWTGNGTHKGELMGIPPTGVQVTETGNAIIRYVGGKAVEVWTSYDLLGMLQQVGCKMTPPLTETTFARVTITQGKVDMMTETIQLYRDSVVPVAKSQNGYRGIYLLSDFITGKAISISLWESEEDAIANEQSGYYKEQVDKFKDFYTAKPVREGYVVTVQE